MAKTVGLKGIGITPKKYFPDLWKTMLGPVFFFALDQLDDHHSENSYRSEDVYLWWLLLPDHL